ncbi:MAG: Rpn family recombination-promoting nuclease/putative transposase [Planctomycetaceae bacterium]|jgi:hypothetical protein|nr:Rpn family recombination-promoting nuclease/putative transposase [Planctomycetaceae bacterium]
MLLSPKSDIVFKLIFGDQRNADVLAAFLQAVLDLPAEEPKSIMTLTGLSYNEIEKLR